MKGKIEGFSLCRNGPKLTHLFFANDCLIFCRSTMEECHKIQLLLNFYEVASGQMIKKEKTTQFFLAEILMHRHRMLSKRPSMSKLYNIMKNM